MDINELILNDIKTRANEKNMAFMSKLVPDVDPQRVLGLYSADLKAIAKKYADNEHIDGFLNDLPHFYLEENTIHGLIICGIKDYSECVKRLDVFFSFVDNWATCDSMRPKVFAKNTARAKADVMRWIRSDLPYTARFGTEMAMTYYLGENFDHDLADAVIKINIDHYYVKMMVAWYLATALCKNRDYAMDVIKSKTLDKFTHNMAIKKAIESYRVTNEDKNLLKTLKMQ